MKNKKIPFALRIVIYLVLLVLCAVIIYFNFDFKKENTKVNEIDNFEYVLSKNDSAYQKELFEELKHVLSEEKIDEESYARVAAKYFLTDLYSLDAKEGENDIGGLEFILEDDKTNFKTLCKTTIYNNIGLVDTLPLVTNVEIKDLNSLDVEYKDNMYLGYEIKAQISYNKPLGYDENVFLTLIDVDDKIYVISFESGDINE